MRTERNEKGRAHWALESFIFASVPIRIVASRACMCLCDSVCVNVCTHHVYIVYLSLEECSSALTLHFVWDQIWPCYHVAPGKWLSLSASVFLSVK